MDFIRRRAIRHYFGGPAEVTDVNSKKQLLASTTDLSMFGCFVKTANPFPQGTSVALKITHRGVIFAVCGKVAHAQQKRGMGISFGAIEPDHQTVLDSWLARSEVRRSSPGLFDNAT
jgi:hypothetical protein